VIGLVVCKLPLVKSMAWAFFWEKYRRLEDFSPLIGRRRNGRVLRLPPGACDLDAESINVSGCPIERGPPLALIIRPRIPMSALVHCVDKVRGW
jgi:hypothetical protein